MNLEQLRKQAKELVKGARAGDETALGRLGGREPILASAQLALAREQGYSSWHALVAAAEANPDAFVEAATDGRRQRAEALLAARPEIERDPWVLLVLVREWAGDPTSPGGPRSWAPLLYVCHTVFANVELARELLTRGADPNASAQMEWGTTTALYGAAGVIHDPELTRLLLEAGADPDDNESLYHSVAADDPACVSLLLEAGAETRGTNALAHALDYDRIEPVRLLARGRRRSERGRPIETSPPSRSCSWRTGLRSSLVSSRSRTDPCSTGWSGRRESRRPASALPDPGAPRRAGRSPPRSPPCCR
jgi:hypothetical protein